MTATKILTCLVTAFAVTAAACGEDPEQSTPKSSSAEAQQSSELDPGSPESTCGYVGAISAVVVDGAFENEGCRMAGSFEDAAIIGTAMCMELRDDIRTGTLADIDQCSACLWPELIGGNDYPENDVCADACPGVSADDTWDLAIDTANMLFGLYIEVEWYSCGG
ncbi:MAG: hypothetical protein V3T05_09865 [Myxococcota bacterium]